MRSGYPPRARLKPIIFKDMKRITKFLVIAAVAASAAACAPAQKTAITAHRGFWNCEEAGYAQNSIKALEMAQVNQFWGSEFDVQMTRDLVLIVNHDNSIDGMKIWDHDFADFKDCRLKNGEKIPRATRPSSSANSSPRETRLMKTT